MTDPYSLQGKRFLVTGASSGIGKAIAILLSRQGAHVILVGRNLERLQATLSTMDNCEKHSISSFDLSHSDEIPQWMSETTASFGLLDGFVHCAGIEKTRSIRFETSSTIDELMTINVYAGFGLTKGYLNKKVGKPGGSLVFVSSITGLVGQPGHSAYSASKGALIAFVRSLAVELAPQKTRVNCVAPGIVKTEMFEEWEKSASSEQIENLTSQYPLGIGSPEDVAQAVSFLLSDASRWITGTTLVVDGGLTSH